MVNSRSISNWTLKLLIKSRKGDKLATVLFLPWSRCQEDVKKCILSSDLPIVILDPYIFRIGFCWKVFLKDMSLELLWNQISCQLVEAQPYCNDTLLCWQRARYVGYYFIMVLIRMYLDRMGLNLLWDNYYLFGATNVTNNLSRVVKPLLY